jgi:hypothetical protein
MNARCDGAFWPVAHSSDTTQGELTGAWPVGTIYWAYLKQRLQASMNAAVACALTFAKYHLASFLPG